MRHAVLAAVAVAVALALVVPAFAAMPHPDKCYYCHAVDAQNDAGAVPDTTDEYHYISPASDAWNRCGRCHYAGWAGANGLSPTFSVGTGATWSGLHANLSASVHSGIGCKCHAIVHVGNYTAASGTYANQYHVAIYITVLNATAQRPGTLTTFEKKYYWTSTELDSNLGAVPGDIGAELMVFDGTNWVKATQKYLVCFNCHFTVEGWATAGAVRVEQGVVKIGIPEFALRLPPHAITPEALRALARGAAPPAPTAPADIFTPLLTLVSTLAGAFLLRRKV